MENKKPCHHYHLNKCRNPNCTYSHVGMPSGKCIYKKNCKFCTKPEQLPQNQNPPIATWQINKKTQKTPFITPDSTTRHSQNQNPIRPPTSTNNRNNQNTIRNNQNIPQNPKTDQKQNQSLYNKPKSSSTSHKQNQRRPPSRDNRGQNQGIFPDFSKNDNNNQRNRNVNKYNNNRNSQQQKVKICHEHDLTGTCSKQGNCGFEHSENISKVCKFQNCRKCCHDYQLTGTCAKQLQGKCKNWHYGKPSNRCIFGECCVICNNSCHQYQIRGYCKKKKYCKFNHEGEIKRKCPFGGIKCLLCNFRRQIAGPCHFKSLKGHCNNEAQCQYSHKVQKIGRCINPFCGIPKCFNNRKQKKCQEAQKQIDMIANQINDADIFPDQLKATELVQDNKILKNNKKKKTQKDDFYSKISFTNLQYDAKDVTKKMAIARNVLKQALGFNYQVTKGIKSVQCKGKGTFTTVQGDQGEVYIEGQNVEIKLNNETRKLKIEEPLLVNILVKDSKYYTGIQNHFVSDSETENEDETEKKVKILKNKFKNTNKNNKLQEQNILFLPEPLNVPVLGNFELNYGNQNQQKPENHQQNSHNEEKEEEKKDDLQQQNYQQQQYQQQYEEQEQKDIGKSQSISLNLESSKLILDYLNENRSIIKKEQAKVKDIEEFQRKRDQGLLEICFLMDTTFSMDEYIIESKNTIKTIMEQVSQKFQGTKFSIKYSMVCYKDHCDEKKHYLVKSQDFLQNTQQMINFIDSLDAIGGGDLPEAVLDGIAEVFKLSWNKQDLLDIGGTQRLVFHILDAPPHGKQFNNGIDDYPEGCPCKLKFRSLATMINNNDICYNMIAIDNKLALKKTIKEFEKYLQSFNFCQIKDSQNMTENVIKLLQQLPFWRI